MTTWLSIIKVSHSCIVHRSIEKLEGVFFAALMFRMEPPGKCHCATTHSARLESPLNAANKRKVRWVMERFWVSWQTIPGETRRLFSPCALSPYLHPSHKKHGDSMAPAYVPDSTQHFIQHCKNKAQVPTTRTNNSPDMHMTTTNICWWSLICGRLEGRYGDCIERNVSERVVACWENSFLAYGFWIVLRVDPGYSSTIKVDALCSSRPTLDIWSFATTLELLSWK